MVLRFLFVGGTILGLSNLGSITGFIQQSQILYTRTDCSSCRNVHETRCFTVTRKPSIIGSSQLCSTADSTTSAITTDSSNVPDNNSKYLEEEVAALKRVLEREYISFFNPMKKEYYASSVTFDDPLTSLDGVDSYQNNVDMLGGRSLFGQIAFKDGNIILHKLSGGEISEDGRSISDIITRWTLKFTFKLLPWSPTAVFSGISVYGVKPTSQVSSGSTGASKPGVQIVSQADYWDSIDMLPGGEYKRADKSKALGDFLDQLNPNKVLGLSPSAMSSELPYTLLRRGNGYEVRRYPAFASAKIQYQRRDEGYDILGSFTNSMNPLSPAIMKVPSDGGNKIMLWPIAFKSPVETSLKVPDSFMEKVSKQSVVEIEPSKEQVVAVGIFADASTEPVVRENAKQLRQALKRDGLKPKDDNHDNGGVTFAQYDAVYTMGKRRGEVWIELADDGHPWN